MNLPKLAHITLPSKKVYEEKPCDCNPPVDHGPHWVLKSPRNDPTS